MDIQLLEKHHIGMCCRLFVDVFSREPWNEQYESDEEVNRYFVNFLSLDSSLGFVGLEEGRLIALCIGMRKPWLKGVEYYIDQFCVAHDRQHKGTGSQFLAEIERRIADMGMKGMLLNTEKSYPSYGFYRKNGFTEIEGLVVMGKGMIGTGKESAASTDIPTCLKKSPSGRKLAEISVVYFSLDM